MSDILLSGDRIIKAHPLNAVAKGSCFTGHTDTAVNFLLSLKGETKSGYHYDARLQILLKVSYYRFVPSQNEQDRRFPFNYPSIPKCILPLLINSIDLAPFSRPIFKEIIG